MLHSILLQAAAGGGFMPIILMSGMILVFYFFMIRPQQKKQKDQQAYVDGLKSGDKVVTIGGLHGSIISVREKTVILEVDANKGVRMIFEKSAISKDNSASIVKE
ncbi:MAG: preprotein translocase subunit YajC [Pseudarcicella sp.]|nr:preprotein translocase subunit YajC [Pseudarcicella sp.]MBP6410517.1 preprotein translocase subunit YajC [Pseudarcicella sp.]